MAAKVKTIVFNDSCRTSRTYSCMRSIHACPLNTTGASPVARCVYMGHCDLVFIFACFLNLVLVAKSQRGTMTSLTNYTHICLLGAVLGFTDKMRHGPTSPSSFRRHGPGMKELGLVILTCFFLSLAELTEREY